MKDPSLDLERRVDELEAHVQRLQRELAQERTQAVRRARRERWLRLAFLVLLGVAYAIYFQRIGSLA